MEAETSLDLRCTAIVRRLAVTECWDLPPEHLALIVALAVRYLRTDVGEAQICITLRNIRLDHRIVEALRLGNHQAHTQEWSAWVAQIRAILRHAGLNWAADGAVDHEDLTQIALLELSNSLPNYRYASRFSTWAYQVVTRGVQRHLRDMSAKKRLGLIAYDTDPWDLAIAGGVADQPEAHTVGRLLSEEVDIALRQALGPEPGPRLRRDRSGTPTSSEPARDPVLAVRRVWLMVLRLLNTQRSIVA
jgi:DNA-directed RNA polymerase specialized sigma24 family protein